MNVSGLVDELRRDRQLPPPRVMRLIRMTAGATQAQVARTLGVHKQTVTRWELGLRRPRGDLLGRYLELLEALQADTLL